MTKITAEDDINYYQFCVASIRYPPRLRVSECVLLDLDAGTYQRRRGAHTILSAAPVAVCTGGNQTRKRLRQSKQGWLAHTYRKINKNIF